CCSVAIRRLNIRTRSATCGCRTESCEQRKRPAQSPAPARSPRTQLVTQCQLVLDALDAVDLLGHLRGTAASFCRIHEAAELHDALECLDADLVRLGRRIGDQRSL